MITENIHFSPENRDFHRRENEIISAKAHPNNCPFLAIIYCQAIIYE